MVFENDTVRAGVFWILVLVGAGVAVEALVGIGVHRHLADGFVWVVEAGAYTVEQIGSKIWRAVSGGS